MTVKICDSTGGGCDFVTADVADLGMTSVGHDTVDHDTRSTDAVAVAFYSEPNFEGICHSVRPEGQRGLRSDVVDKVSSVAVNHHCRQDVQLCEHENLEGQCVSFRTRRGWAASGSRNRTLWHNFTRNYNSVPNDSASSITVPNDSASSITVPNDSASSITVSNDATCYGRFDPRCVGILPGL